MNDASFSRFLKEERLRRGLTLEQASASTKVRQQILVAFEEGDFESMPPRGYAKNMIASYARWLGLSPQGVVETYLDDLAVFESDRNFEDDPYRYYGSRDTGRGESSRRGRPKRYQRDERPNTSPRLYDIHGANDMIDHDRRRAQGDHTFRSTSIGNTGGHNGHVSRSSRIFSDKKTYRRGGGDNHAKLIIIIMVAVILVALTFILASYVSSCSKKADSLDTPVASTTKVDNGSSSDTQTGTSSTSIVLDSPFTVSFSVADAQTCTIVAKVDGLDAYNGTAVGPMTQTFAVSTSATMTFSNPSAVTVTRDGQPVSITVGSDGTGSVSLAVSSSSGQPSTGTTDGAGSTGGSKSTG